LKVEEKREGEEGHMMSFVVMSFYLNPIECTGNFGLYYWLF